MSQLGRRQKTMKIADPLVIMFKGQDDDVICHIHPGKLTHEHYGLLVCDLVRHVAAAFKVNEDAVWEWVNKERHRPTTKISQPS